MPHIEIDWKQKYLEIRGVYLDGNSYDISFDRVINRDEFWVEHLREKNWWNEILEKDFIEAIELISKKNG